MVPAVILWAPMQKHYFYEAKYSWRQRDYVRLKDVSRYEIIQLFYTSGGGSIRFSDFFTATWQWSYFKRLANTIYVRKQLYMSCKANWRTQPDDFQMGGRENVPTFEFKPENLIMSEAAVWPWHGKKRIKNDPN